MSIFKEIEKKEDEQQLKYNREKYLHQARMELIHMKMARVEQCKYRKPEGFYNVKCEHPDRSIGRQCISIECPTI